MWSARTSAPSATATSSRQTESRPPESSTTTGRPAGSSPVAPTRSSSGSLIVVAHMREEELRRLGEALEPHLADQVELQLRARAFDHRPRDQHLAARGARRDARRQVHLAPVVVAVAVDGLAVVDADPWQRALGVQRLEADGPV